MKKNNNLLWCILAVAVVALVITVVMCWGTLKSALGLAAEAPANVRSEDMIALFQNDKIDEDKLTAYAVVWEDNLHKSIESGKQQNTDLAAADLKSEVEKATNAIEKINSILSLVSNDNRTTINTVAMKAKSDVESAQRFIDSHAQPAAKPSAPSSPSRSSSASSGSPTGQYVVITGDAVRLRTGPGFDYGVYTHVNRGNTIPYVSTSGDWNCVNYKGRTLYVSTQFSYIQ